MCVVLAVGKKHDMGKPDWAWPMKIAIGAAVRQLHIEQRGEPAVVTSHNGILFAISMWSVCGMANLNAVHFVLLR